MKFPVILVILISFFYSSFLWAAQDAIVKVEQAVIYSDTTMKSPIGFIRKGKRIRVGERALRKGVLLPIIVSRKLAYIKITDITFNSHLEATASTKSSKRMAELYDEEEEREFPVFMNLDFKTLTPNSSFKKDSTYINGKENNTAFQYLARMNIRPNLRRHWLIYGGIDVAYQQDDRVQIWDGGPYFGLQFSFFPERRLDIQIFGEAFYYISPVYIKQVRFSTMKYGSNAGARVLFKLGPYFDLQAGIRLNSFTRDWADTNAYDFKESGFDKELFVGFNFNAIPN